MKLNKISKRRTKCWVLVLFVLVLATACGQTQEGMDLPTVTNLATSTTVGATPSNNGTIHVASTPLSVPLEERNNSGASGICKVSRNKNGDLIWSMKLSGATPGSTVQFYMQAIPGGTFTGILVEATSRGIASSHRQVYSPAPAPGTILQCGSNQADFGGIAQTVPFPAP